MITLENNPAIFDPGSEYCITLAATRSTLIDTDIYSRFIYSCENNFRRLGFYKNYKSFLMNMGLNRDQNMAGITSEMADIQLHHHFPTLKQAAIMITEHLLNTKGCATTFEVVQLLENAHRNNWFSVIFLSQTQHEVFHSDPSNFISLKQCVGDGWKFIDTYIDGMTLDISFKLLLQLKMEEQYGESFSPNLVKAREQIKDWSLKNNNY
jgi:hypothetical protein